MHYSLLHAPSIVQVPTAVTVVEQPVQMSISIPERKKDIVAEAMREVEESNQKKAQAAAVAAARQQQQVAAAQQQQAAAAAAAQQQAQAQAAAQAAAVAEQQVTDYNKNKFMD